VEIFLGWKSSLGGNPPWVKIFFFIFSIFIEHFNFIEKLFLLEISIFIEKIFFFQKKKIFLLEISSFIENFIFFLKNYLY